MERTGLVTFKGTPLTLVGTPVGVGDRAPDFRARKSLLEDVRFSELGARVVVVTAAPSVDTGVCAMQLRAFNQQAVELGDSVAVVYVTMDLPFALKRFCAAEGIDRVLTLSDSRSREFGDRWGLMMAELGLLARSVFVVVDGVVTYAEIVPEMTSEPDYIAALAAVRSGLSAP